MKRYLVISAILCILISGCVSSKQPERTTIIETIIPNRLSLGAIYLDVESGPINIKMPALTVGFEWDLK